MGVQFGDIIPRKEVELIQLSGKKIAIDGYNTLYQFLSIIRDRMTGEPLRDSKGRVTSHLSGVFYRTTNLLEAGIKPIYVFDGKPPEFKKKTIKERKEMKKEAKKKWEEALEKGEKAITYAQATAELSDEMVEETKKLLTLMGVPWVQAPSEGEAQCAYMCKKGSVDAVGSQDYDSLLFGSPSLIRNLSITGRRKLPRKEVYIEIKPELINLGEVLKTLEITREQLIMMGLLIGTDYNEGVERVGPKTALKIVKECKTLKDVLKKVEWKEEVDVEEIFNFFLHPPVTDDYELKWREPDEEKLFKFMVEEHDFSPERVEKTINKLKSVAKRGTQSTLSGWFKR